MQNKPHSTSSPSNKSEAALRAEAKAAEQNLIGIARVTKPHGIKGDAKLISYTQNPEDIFNYPHLYDENLNKYLLKKRSATINYFIVSINGCNNRNYIEEIAGQQLYITHDMLAATQSDEYYHEDLKDLELFNQDKKPCGKIVDIQNFGAGDILEVKLTDAKDTNYLPFQDEFIIEINIEKGYLIYNLKSFVD